MKAVLLENYEFSQKELPKYYCAPNINFIVNIFNNRIKNFYNVQTDL